MKIKKVAAVGFFFSAALVGVIVASGAAAKATDTEVPHVKSECPEVSAWYFHTDNELAWKDNVTSTEAGLVFDGPSLIHHTFPDTKLKDLPKHADLVTEDVTGAEPLVKFRTDLPFSTINIDLNGMFWSSKIEPASPGGISAPVAKPENLVGLTLDKNGGTTKYTDDTVIKDIQIGYASDTGNKATVTSLVYAGDVFNFKCKPETTPTANPTTPPATDPPTSQPTDGPTGGPGPGARPTLPKTGPNGVQLFGIGGGIIVIGGLIVFAARRKK